MEKGEIPRISESFWQSFNQILGDYIKLWNKLKYPRYLKVFAQLFSKSWLPVELPFGIEHTVESLHKEVVAPDIHFVNAVITGLTVGCVKEQTV